MQTFLPYPDFAASARCLDYRRLGKQRVECAQILNALARGTGGWVNHPASRMWFGYERTLRQYQRVMIVEWIERGYRNSMTVPDEECVYDCGIPSWLGDEAFHASHRSNLLRKDPEWYGQFGWSEAPDLEYVWPVSGLRVRLTLMRVRP